MELPSRFCSDFIITALLGNRRCTQPLDHCKYTDKQITADCNLCELKGDGTGVSHNPCANFDQPGLQAGQRPIGYLLGKVRALHDNRVLHSPIFHSFNKSEIFSNFSFIE